MIAMEYARTLMGYAVVFGLASTVGKGDGVTVEYDPRSIDFGKIKIVTPCRSSEWFVTGDGAACSRDHAPNQNCNRTDSSTGRCQSTFQSEKHIQHLYGFCQEQVVPDTICCVECPAGEKGNRRADYDHQGSTWLNHTHVR